MAFATIDLTKGVTGVLPSANATYSTPRDNAAPLIINGNMAVAQRSTSVTSITSGGFNTVDRFKLNLNSLGTWTQTQNTLSASDTPFTHGFTKSLKMDVTTANGSPSSSADCQIYYLPEGQDLQLLKKGTANAEKITIGFWIKATKTGTNILAIYDRDNNRLNSQSYTVSSSDTWEYKVVNFPADTTGAIDNDNNKSFELRWVLAVGSDLTSGSLQTTWATYTNANYAVGQVNNADSTSNNWEITGVQLEVGEFTSATLPPFQFESFGDNLARCQRYFTMIADGRLGGGSNEALIGAGYCHATNSNYFADGILPVKLRTYDPSIFTVTGTSNYKALRDNGEDYFDNLVMYSQYNSQGFSVNGTGNVSATQGHGIQMRLGSSSTYLGVDSEL